MGPSVLRMRQAVKIVVPSAAVVMVCWGCGETPGSAAEATVPTAQPTACSPREFEVKLDVQPGADQVSIGAEFANLRPHACEMKAQLFLSVKDGTGANRDVVGNRAPVEISARFGAHDRGYAVWHWLNWCGSRGESEFSLAGDGVGAVVRSNVAPLCLDPARGSILERVPLKEALVDPE